MDIREATRKALKTGQGIYNKDFKSVIYLLPTNTAECYIYMPFGYTIHDKNGLKPAPRWQPSAKDILRTDWMLCDGTVKERHTPK